MNIADYYFLCSDHAFVYEPSTNGSYMPFFSFYMEHLFAESNTWDIGIDPSLDIPSEETYQRYLVNLYYQTIEYQNYSARFSPKRTAKIQWFSTDIALA